MPGSFIPHASASHRVACVRLYRALLRQTSLLQNHNNALSDVVRYRFHRDRKLVSPTQVANGLDAGYAVLDLVHACNSSDGGALKKLVQMVESTTAQAETAATWRSALANSKRPPSPRTLAKVEHVKAVADKAKNVRYQESKPILQRPLPLSEIRGGSRRVPNLVTAQGIPFLRYSKPQPIALSRVIRQKVRWNERNWMLRGMLEEQILLAEFEDDWDQILRHEHGVMDEHTTNASAGLAEPSWTEEFRNADAAIKENLRVRDRKNAEMGEVMWEIVKKEKALKKQEKIERRAARKVMRAVDQEANVLAPSESEPADDGPPRASSGMEHVKAPLAPKSNHDYK